MQNSKISDDYLAGYQAGVIATERAYKNIAPYNSTSEEGQIVTLVQMNRHKIVGQNTAETIAFLNLAIGPKVMARILRGCGLELRACRRLGKVARVWMEKRT